MPIPQLFRYDKPLSKFFIYRKLKVSAIFFFLKKGDKNVKLFLNWWPYGYECWHFWRDLCKLSKKYSFATFSKI